MVFVIFPPKHLIGSNIVLTRISRNVSRNIIYHLQTSCSKSTAHNFHPVSRRMSQNIKLPHCHTQSFVHSTAVRESNFVLVKSEQQSKLNLFHFATSFIKLSVPTSLQHTGKAMQACHVLECSNKRRPTELFFSP